MSRASSRRDALAELLATAACCAARPSLAAIPPTGRFGILRVLGDSYSSMSWRFRKWPEWLMAIVPYAERRVWATGGSSMADLPGRSTFSQQVTQVVGRIGSLRAHAVTVVYFGHIDINIGVDLNLSRSALREGLNRLIDAGLTSNSGQIILVQCHDWGSCPSQNASWRRARSRARTLEWNAHVRDEAAGRSRVGVVDLFSLFDPILADPAAYGFTNVKTADPENAATTALFHDANHFGERGNRMIASAIAAKLLAP